MRTARRNWACAIPLRAAALSVTLTLGLVSGGAAPACPDTLPGGPARAPVAGTGPSPAGVTLALGSIPGSADAAAGPWASPSRMRTAQAPPPTARVSRPRSPRRLALGLGLALGGGGFAWWAHGRADQAYVKYLDTAGVGAQRHWLAQARRRDRAAGAALLGMEAGLLLTTYWLLH